MAGLRQGTAPSGSFSHSIHYYPDTTSYEDPRSRHRSFHQNSKHFNNMAAEYIPLRDIKTISRGSPLAVKSTKIQDSSFTVTDTDEAVAKISAMFPTVSETHIRMLMKNCRYMKSVFPKAEETIILEILQNNDNNIQKTTDILKEMGFQKKDTVKAAQQKLQTKIDQEKIEQDARNKEPPPITIPKLKTSEEKAAIKSKLREKYKDVAKQLITIALESVDYNENRANQILEIVIQEDNEKNNQPSTSQVEDKGKSPENELKPPSLPVSQSRQSIKSLIKSEKIDMDKTYNRVFEQSPTQYKSSNTADNKGPNPNVIKGPNEKLLLVNYLEWQGPNRSFWKGSQSLAKGPNRNLLISNRSCQPCGSNPELCKGPQIGLAKGSIFSQLKSIIVGESRGK